LPTFETIDFPWPPKKEEQGAKKQEQKQGEKKEKAVGKEEEVETCMICLDAPPNTLVLPCQHCVVCKACSQGLKKTPDANKCVRCRKDIVDVLQDE
jgi:hypothetical protein